jgi:CheY-like chemotaxis protein
VLLIDDEEISRYLLRQLLAGQCDTVEASTGAEGIEQLRRIKPDAVFLDLNMPGLSGFDVLAEIENDSVGRSTPVVIVTALKLDSDAREKLAARVTAILSKEALAKAESLAIDFGPPLSVWPRIAGN